MVCGVDDDLDAVDAVAWAWRTGYRLQATGYRSPTS